MDIRIVITDLDNTLWDWFRPWYSSFSAMLEMVALDSGVPRAILESEIRGVHQRHGTSEYTFVLDELPSLQRLSGSRLPSEKFKEAANIRAEIRRRDTVLYPTVLKTLDRLLDKGLPVVAFTESSAFWTEWRIRATGLDGRLRSLYSAPDHDFPDGRSRESVRTKDRSEYGLRVTEHRLTPPGYLKPDKSILVKILEDFNLGPESAVYVGDSLMKDVAMAKEAHVLAAWAKYGVASEREEYSLLRRVTHWTDEDVAREREIYSKSSVSPDLILENSFSEILEVLGV